MLDLAVIPKIPGLGETIGHQFVLGKEIGRGSMGAVFEARQLGLDRRVALKLLLPRALVIEGVVERFQRGAKLASSLTHPNAVIIHAIGVHEDPDGGLLPYMAMEHLDGEDLYDYIHRKGRLALEETLWIAREMLGVLADAHKKNIIHRDLKPENLFMHRRDDGQRGIKVLDFGLAKAVMEDLGSRERRLTATGITCGTPEYMAPEQAVGEENITSALDVYGVGCILYHMLVGGPPFSGKSPMAIALKHVSEPAPPLPAEYTGTFIEEIILRALSKRPEYRFADAGEVAKALEDGIAGVHLPDLPGWPSREKLARNYRLAAEDVEDIDTDKIPEWAAGTLQMAAVQIGGPTANQPMFFDLKPPDLDSDTLPFDINQFHTHDEDLEGPATSVYRSMPLAPGSVSINLPGSPPDSGPIDYGAEGVRTVITNKKPPPPTIKSPHMPAPAPPSRAPRPRSTTQPTAPQTHRATALWLLIAAAVVLGVAAIGLSLFFFVPRAGLQTDKVQEKTSQRISIRIDSLPSGAEVIGDGEVLGLTPLDLELSKEEKTLWLTLKKEGYRDRKEQIPLNSDGDLRFDLKKIPRSDWDDTP